MSAAALSGTHEKILLAAEVEFAEKGFDGAGMKAIAVRGKVSQALLHYHFGTKDRLYAEVIRHRSEKINGERIALLDRVRFGRPDAIDEVLEALFRPPLGPSGGDRPYARIFSGLIVGREREQALVRECYDSTARRFIDAITRSLPTVDREMAAIGYSLSLGALVTVIARDDRLERLIGRDTRSALIDKETILERLIAFTAGGILALGEPSSGPSERDIIMGRHK